MVTQSRSPWLAIDAVTDRLAHAHSLRRVHDAFQSGQEVGGRVRAVVARSWERSDEAGIDRPVVSLIGYSNPRRVGPYQKFQDLLIDAYGEPGEDYPISMENRLNRMPRISVDDVLSKVQLWKSAYAVRYGDRSVGAAAALSG